MSTCEDRSGVLFAHACDRAATGVCAQCLKAICPLHMRPAIENGVPAALCVGCARERGVLGEDDRFSRDTRYDADDRRLFDRSRGSGVASGRDDWESDPNES